MTDFLSREAREEKALGTGEDEGQLALVVSLLSSSDLETFVVDVKHHFCGEAVQEEDPKICHRIRRTSNYFLIWNDELFLRTPLGPYTSSRSASTSRPSTPSTTG